MSHALLADPGPSYTSSTQPAGSSLFESWPETKDLGREDIEGLLSDESYFEAFFRSLPRIKAYDDALDRLLAANEEMTAANNAQRPQLQALRDETRTAFDEATRLKSRWAQLERDQQQAYRRYEPPQLLSRLQHAVTEQDRLSEAIAAEFQNGSVDDDQALARYRELRRVFHRRALQSELWSQGRVKW